MSVELAILILLWLCAPPATLYAIFYAFRPWRSTPQGQALMLKAVGTALLLDMGLATLMFGEDYPGRNVIRLTAFTLWVAGIWYLLITLLISPGARKYPPFRWRRKR